jgi:hypothetical protein
VDILLVRVDRAESFWISRQRLTRDVLKANRFLGGDSLGFVPRNLKQGRSGSVSLNEMSWVFGGNEAWKELKQALRILYLLYFKMPPKRGWDVENTEPCVGY